LLGAVVAGVVVIVSAGGCSRSGLDYELAGVDGGTGDDGPLPEGAPPPSCGNGKCDGSETCENCPVDCGLCPGCGDGKCIDGETCSSCPQDCGACATCGDGKCKSGETCLSCPQDCGVCPGCGDGKCTGTETCFTCPADCGKCPGCGDGICKPTENCSSCPMDCGPCDFCGDGKCTAPYETCINCPVDCGMCPVHTCFQDLTCAIGCFGGLGGGGGGFGGGDGGIPNINLTCIVDCLAEGCASAQYFAQQAVNCFIENLGTCGGFSLNCLMSACSGPVAACIGDHC
jgi:hypothetical protein